MSRQKLEEVLDYNQVSHFMQELEECRFIRRVNIIIMYVEGYAL